MEIEGIKVSVFNEENLAALLSFILTPFSRPGARSGRYGSSRERSGTPSEKLVVSGVRESVGLQQIGQNTKVCCQALNHTLSWLLDMLYVFGVTIEAFLCLSNYLLGGHPAAHLDKRRIVMFFFVLSYLRIRS